MADHTVSQIRSARLDAPYIQHHQHINLDARARRQDAIAGFVLTNDYDIEMPRDNGHHTDYITVEQMRVPRTESIIESKWSPALLDLDEETRRNLFGNNEWYWNEGYWIDEHNATITVPLPLEGSAANAQGPGRTELPRLRERYKLQLPHTLIPIEKAWVSKHGQRLELDVPHGSQYALGETFFIIDYPDTPDFRISGRKYVVLDISRGGSAGILTDTLYVEYVADDEDVLANAYNDLVNSSVPDDMLGIPAWPASTVLLTGKQVPVTDAGLSPSRGWLYIPPPNSPQELADYVMQHVWAIERERGLALGHGTEFTCINDICAEDADGDCVCAAVRVEELLRMNRLDGSAISPIAINWNDRTNTFIVTNRTTGASLNLLSLFAQDVALIAGSHDTDTSDPLVLESVLESTIDPYVVEAGVNDSFDFSVGLDPTVHSITLTAGNYTLLSLLKTLIDLANAAVGDPALFDLNAQWRREEGSPTHVLSENLPLGRITLANMARLPFTVFFDMSAATRGLASLLGFTHETRAQSNEYVSNGVVYPVEVFSEDVLTVSDFDDIQQASRYHAHTTYGVEYDELANNFSIHCAAPTFATTTSYEWDAGNGWLTITTTTPHGYAYGDLIVFASGDATQLHGVHRVERVIDGTSFAIVFQDAGAVGGPVAATINLFPLPRPFNVFVPPRGDTIAHIFGFEGHGGMNVLTGMCNYTGTYFCAEATLCEYLLVEISSLVSTLHYHDGYASSMSMPNAQGLAHLKLEIDASHDCYDLIEPLEKHPFFPTSSSNKHQLVHIRILRPDGRLYNTKNCPHNLLLQMHENKIDPMHPEPVHLPPARGPF